MRIPLDMIDAQHEITGFVGTCHATKLAIGTAIEFSKDLQKTFQRVSNVARGVER